MLPVRDAALLLVGHGSTLNADSSTPTHRHAEEIRRRGLFAEVHVTFWKEEPNFRQALRQTARPEVYVVPNFISSGYFTEEVLPRELGLDGEVTRRDGQAFYYCQPVGLHASMTEALLQRAAQVVAGSGETIPNPAQTACLFICGHGTSFNDNSTKIIHEQAAAIRARGLYADCQPVLMEQQPFVKDWRTLTPCPDVIVVPFFISDGLHSFEDIPVLLGLTHNVREKEFANPQHENGRRLWYATAIGTDPFIADVILAQVEQFRAEHLGVTVPTQAFHDPIGEELDRFFARTAPPWTIGQVLIQPSAGGSFQLRHRDDADVENLPRLHAISDLRERVRFNAEGRFRPLPAAPDLRRGWIYEASDRAALRLALDCFYPAGLANWSLWNRSQLPVTPWRETVERQTGRFRVVREIDDTSAQELATRVCEAGCLKQRLWAPAGEKVVFGPSEIPLLCPEACNLLVERGREKLKGTGTE